ncbi:MAG: HlyD family efflux transporter periplasmic adaptor subunit [Pseudomonadota bacterium]
MTAENDIELPIRQVRRSAVFIACVLLCALVWARMAPLTTTLEVSGVLAANATSAKVQATEFGSVQEVFAGNFDVVKAGDILAKLDDGALHTERFVASKRRDDLTIEGALIAHELHGTPIDADLDFSPGITSAFQAARAFHEDRISGLRAQADLSELRFWQLDEQVQVAKDRVVIASDRASDLGQLRASGIGTSLAFTDAALDELELAQELSRLESDRSQARETKEKAELEIQAEKSARRSDLATRFAEIEVEVAQLKERLAQLEARSDGLVLLAPRDGELSEWSLSPFETVSPGDVVGQVTGALGPMHIALNIAPDLIDQVSVGQQGIVTFSTLPQRSMPRVAVTLASKAQVSHLEPGADVPTYSAIASFNESEFSKLSDALSGNYYLALDVPVTVILEGREMTAWSYVFDPLISAFRRAAQD